MNLFNECMGFLNEWPDGYSLQVDVVFASRRVLLDETSLGYCHHHAMLPYALYSRIHQIMIQVYTPLSLRNINGRLEIFFLYEL